MRIPNKMSSQTKRVRMLTVNWGLGGDFYGFHYLLKLASYDFA